MARTPAEVYLLRRQLLDDHLGSCQDCLWWYQDEASLPTCGDVYLLHRDVDDAYAELSPLEQLATEGLDD